MKKYHLQNVGMVYRASEVDIELDFLRASINGLVAEINAFKIVYEDESAAPLIINDYIDKIFDKAKIAKEDIQMPKFPNIEVKLSDLDSNPYSILGRVKKEMLRSSVSRDEITAFLAEAMSGDYGKLLSVCMKWVRIV